ncbi:MAG: 3-deoxy-8-phosphooctulonate synthase [Candidatus Krumholzibacteriota bacterium]|nr:3-deoxy-8-phosphooctulonate synthase [Candidatus Krumholzibacteriota bacterium]
MDGPDIGGWMRAPGEKPLLIAGPCVLEDETEALRIAEHCVRLAREEGFFYVFKSSYLKDNRSSIDSYTGPGLKEGLNMLERIGARARVPVLTDVHCREEVGPAAEVCDVLQIPAFLARQTRLIVEAARTGRILNLKKGQFLSPEEMAHAVEKARRGGAAGVMITERGTFFGYNNLVVDMTSFARMKPLQVPLIFDATHSLQLPGGSGDRSGGRPQFARYLARAAAAAGCDGLFVETHFAPLSCKCDAEAMLPLDDLKGLLREVAQIFRIGRHKDEKH